jgi:hypothetical protein
MLCSSSGLFGINEQAMYVACKSEIWWAVRKEGRYSEDKRAVGRKILKYTFWKGIV